jgi:hypothetical protein
MRLLTILSGMVLISAASGGCGGSNKSEPQAENWTASADQASSDGPVAYNDQFSGIDDENLASNASDDLGNTLSATHNYANGDTHGNELTNSNGTTEWPAVQLVYCARVQDRISAADCAYYEEVWGRMERGQAAIDVPPQMVRGTPVRVSFAVNRAEAEVSANEMLDSSPEQTAQIRVGRRMAVQLQGEGFTVEPQGLVERDLGPGGAERWDWTVTPQRRGRLTLTFSAYVVMRPGGAERSQSLIRTLAREVDVTVSPADVTKDAITESKGWFELTTGWLVALTALIGTGLLGLWVAIRQWRDRNKPTDGGAAEPAVPPSPPAPPGPPPAPSDPELPS